MAFLSKICLCGLSQYDYEKVTYLKMSYGVLSRHFLRRGTVAVLETASPRIETLLSDKFIRDRLKAHHRNMVA